MRFADRRYTGSARDALKPCTSLNGPDVRQTISSTGYDPAVYQTQASSGTKKHMRRTKITMIKNTSPFYSTVGIDNIIWIVTKHSTMSIHNLQIFLSQYGLLSAPPIIVVTC